MKKCLVLLFVFVLFSPVAPAGTAQGAGPTDGTFGPEILYPGDLYSGGGTLAGALWGDFDLWIFICIGTGTFDAEVAAGSGGDIMLGLLIEYGAGMTDYGWGATTELSADVADLGVNIVLAGYIDCPSGFPADYTVDATFETPGTTVVDTDQETCYDRYSEITCPSVGAAFYGQDAQYAGSQPAYQDNGDGTVTDLNTGLMWQQDPGDKMFYYQAVAGADSFSLAGHDDWRLPTIKELYSLILFSGGDPSSYPWSDPSGLTPFIDADAFAFEYGDTSAGERLIDSQWATDNVYLDTVMGGDECFFGVNFADGRIKCYPTSSFMDYFVIYVRGSAVYGVNNFDDNGNGTVTDQATGLMWQQGDSGSGMIWEDALDYCEDLTLAGLSDWRLPDAKELQSIVDYSRSPGTTSSAAIDPIFNVTTIQNEAGQTDYPCYWTGTTHADWRGQGGSGAYVAFGRAMGFFMGQWRDVHGAGAQRSDPKFGDPDDYPQGHGPQGDAVRIYNHVRCVRDEGS